MANYDVESLPHKHPHKHTWYRIMFVFYLFFAPYARTTRHEEAFFPWKTRKERPASLARFMIMWYTRSPVGRYSGALLYVLSVVSAHITVSLRSGIVITPQEVWYTTYPVINRVVSLVFINFITRVVYSGGCGMHV